MITLRWYRDQGRGQEAADDVGAEQDMDGSWPVAILPVDRESSDNMWRYLLSKFGVNSVTHTDNR